MSAPAAWHETLRECVARLARETRSQTAIIGAGTPLTYAQLHARALSLAAGFRALGLGPGDTVAAQLPNSVEFLTCYLAAGYLGATLQTIHMPYRGAEVETLLAHSGAKAVLCLGRAKDASPAEIILSRKAKLPALRHVIAVGEDAPDGTTAFTSIAATAGDDAALPSVTATDRFLLLYTSGTTAAPKGVPVDYACFLANAAASARELAIDRSSILLSAAPFTHLYGLFTVNLALTTGATIALMPPFTPPALAAALDATRATALFCAPAHMSACLNEGLLTRERLGSLRFLQISGSACPPALARTVQDLMPNGTVAQLWGMSELQAGAFTRPSDSLDVRTTRVGRASPGTMLRIADDDATPLPAGHEGELQVRGPSVFSGYLDNADATAAAFTADGWFRTGDLALLDADGNLQITGRLKDVINRGGVKFNCADVETIIGAHAAVASCAIVPMPDPVLGERACCFLVLKPDATITLDDLRAFLTAREVAKLKWPERIEIIADMPMTPTRKVKKTELIARL